MKLINVFHRRKQESTAQRLCMEKLIHNGLSFSEAEKKCLSIIPSMGAGTNPDPTQPCCKGGHQHASKHNGK